MTRTTRGAALVLTLLAVGTLAVHSQMRVIPLDMEQGRVGLGLALRRLANTGIFMEATAHPDDENNGLLVLLNRGLGYRTALATATRGNGGQNEIGPEIFEALGVLRTEELAAIHRFDGAEQYFTRAVDFGYSFSVEETFEKWGREEILGDFVRLIRTVRPDVMLSLSPTGDGGGQHHQASAVLAQEAFRLAADPTKYPEQLEQGLRPWQSLKFYQPVGGFGGGGTPEAEDGLVVPVNLAAYDSLLGRTYAEIGTEARSMHKCQGMAQLLSLPGPASSTFRLVDTAPRFRGRSDETSLFDGIDTSIEGLARFGGSPPPRQLTQGLTEIATAVQDAQSAFNTGAADSIPQLLIHGLGAVRRLRATLRVINVDGEGRAEIESRLLQKEREFQQAIALAAGVRVEALADDGVVVPGQSVRLSVIVANHGAADVSVGAVTFDGFSTNPSCDLRVVRRRAGFGGRGQAPVLPAGPIVSTLQAGQVASCDPSLTIPVDARISEPYWHRDGEAGRYTFDADAPFGLPDRPTQFYVQLALSIGGAEEEIYYGLPVQYRYEGNIFSGEKRTELLVSPSLSVRVSPDVVIVPTASLKTPGSEGREREIRVSVVNGSKDSVQSQVRLDVPGGWAVIPEVADVMLEREDESQTIRFHVSPARSTAPGGYDVAAVASLAGQNFSRGYDVVEYPHISRRHIYYPAQTKLKVVDVAISPDLTVGYVMGVGDAVPAGIRQLGADVRLLDADDLAWGDLSGFDAIVTGVRAYERRADLRANNNRLIDYVRDGGRVIVQYNKFEFNEARYGPWAAKVSSDRVTDEDAPVSVLIPTDPFFTTPNKITDAAWVDWVQERGLYFLGERDSRYRDLVSLEDPFPNNRGVKRGALVVADYGKGRWVYVGLGLWRELPAGVDGAYQLLANLLSREG